MTETIPNQPQQMTIPLPQEIFNCPQCSHYIQPGMLVCPDCHAVVYGRYLQGMANAAQTFEEQERWAEARATWRTMLDYLPAATEQTVAVQQRIAALDNRSAAKAQRSATWKKRLGPFAPVLLLLGKLKTFFFFLLKFKFILSFVGFFGFYWAAFGWKFGLGFSAGILIHEMGHYITARQKGHQVNLPLFIPGFGAYVTWRSQGTSLEELAEIALAGPLYGLGAAAVFAGLAVTLPGPDLRGLFSALAHVTAWLNLLNLIPFLWLDGALAVQALNRMQRALLAATGVVFFFATQQTEWVFLLISAGMTWQAFKPETPENDSGKTLMRFVGLFFALGTLIWLFPVGRIRF